MENTKDLVRAERSSRFVCQVGEGRLPLRDPARGAVSSSHAPSVSGAPLPLLAVKRSRGSPPPSTSDLGFSRVSRKGKKYEKKVFLCPSPAPF